MVFLAFLLNFAFAQNITVNIEGVGRFLEIAPVQYDVTKKILNLKSISCVPADGSIFEDGLEKNIFMRTGKSGPYFALRSLQYDVAAKTFNVIPVQSLSCTTTIRSEEDLESDLSSEN